MSKNNVYLTVDYTTIYYTKLLSQDYHLCLNARKYFLV